VCRVCDRGQIYCGEVCAAAQRQISVLLARLTYARSPKGKLAHARAEARRRLERKAKIVMDQGLATTEPAPILGRAVEASVVLVPNRRNEDDHESIELASCDAGVRGGPADPGAGRGGGPAEGQAAAALRAPARWAQCAGARAGSRRMSPSTSVRLAVSPVVGVVGLVHSGFDAQREERISGPEVPAGATSLTGLVNPIECDPVRCQSSLVLAQHADPIAISALYQ